MNFFPWYLYLHHGVDLALPRLHVQTLHGRDQLVAGDGPGGVRVEEVEGLPELVDLVRGQAAPGREVATPPLRCRHPKKTT